MSFTDSLAGKYFYHLRIELLPTCPTAHSLHNNESVDSERKRKKTKGKGNFLDTGSQVAWLPPKGIDIFGRLPARSKTSGTSKYPSVLQTPETTASVTGAQSRRETRRQGESIFAKETSKSLKAHPQRTTTTPEHTDGAKQHPHKHHDWRIAELCIKSIDMAPLSPLDLSSESALLPTEQPSANSSKRNSSSMQRVQATKAKIELVGRNGEDVQSTDIGWGVVRLYREGKESPAPTTVSTATAGPSESGASEDATVLCIPAVPSYMTPSDFLGWVGEKTMAQVSHFRMVMTEKLNRYMVLMKFRDGDEARRWRKTWDGKVFNGMEPENCHVMFIRSIVFDTPSSNYSDPNISFPDLSHDPFIPTAASELVNDPTAALALRPLPPPTASLIELPTCPVCLERMDSTITGLLTILCQHVFHCACLQKWRGSGCPVCRHVQPSSSLNLSRPFGASDISHDFCSVCDTQDDLWICLICGNVGCGRYKGGHAKEHWTESAHSYSLEIETQHVWDYAGDTWVHRLLQTKGDGKLVELPSSATAPVGFGQGGREITHGEGVEMVPRAKLDGIGLEYTHLLTSQLESQRVYFEDVVKKAVDKAAAASAAAEAASTQATEALAQLQQLILEQSQLQENKVALEKERDRLKTRAEKSAELARKMTVSFQEEKQVGKGLMERIGHIGDATTKLQGEVAALKAENEDLKEQNRDLGFFISSQEKLREVGNQIGEDVTEGTLSLPEKREAMRKGKGKGRGK